MLKQAKSTIPMDKVESYSMRSLDVESPNETEVRDRTIMVKRMDLIFNERECQVLNFTDITAY